MKFLSLLILAGQFGFSVSFPLLFFLLLSAWLRSRFCLGSWITVVFGILGILTSIRTTRACLRSLRRAAEEAGENKEPPTSFNHHL